MRAGSWCGTSQASRLRRWPEPGRADPLYALVMTDYGGETYGERWAGIYDDWVARYARVADAELVADRLAELGGAGPALELAIGTSRIALPLAARGELDLMARLAGLRLRDRWGGWNREPFMASSDNHVSLYART